MEVHWLEQSARDLPPIDDWLSSDEQRRSSGMRFERRRADWRLGRWTAKLAVAGWFKQFGRAWPLLEIEVRAEPSGAPRVWLEGKPAPVAISLSHRDGNALCTVASEGAMLGCDLEVVEARGAAFLSDYFTLEEQRFVTEAAPWDQARSATLVWSAKESALKALGVGLRLDTRRAVVGSIETKTPGEWRPLRVSCEGYLFFGWWSQSNRMVRTVVAFPAPESPLRIAQDSIDQR